MSKHTSNTKEVGSQGVPIKDRPEGTPELTEVERKGEMPIVDTVADGQGNENPDTKASTLEKQKVDAILDAEEAHERAKHTKN